MKGDIRVRVFFHVYFCLLVCMLGLSLNACSELFREEKDGGPGVQRPFFKLILIARFPKS